MTRRLKVTRTLNEELRWALDEVSLGEAIAVLKKIEDEHPDKELTLHLDLEHSWGDTFLNVYLSYEDAETDEEMLARMKAANIVQEREKEQLKKLLEKYGNQG